MNLRCRPLLDYDSILHSLEGGCEKALSERLLAMSQWGADLRGSWRQAARTAMSQGSISEENAMPSHPSVLHHFMKFINLTVMTIARVVHLRGPQQNGSRSSDDQLLRFHIGVRIAICCRCTATVYESVYCREIVRIVCLQVVAHDPRP